MNISTAATSAWRNRQLVTGGVGIVLLGGLLALAEMLHVAGGSYLRGTTLLCVVAGVAFGGLLGSLASPKSNHENKQFKQVAAIATSFLGGFTLAELFKLLGDPRNVAVLFDNDLYFGRLLLFVASMALSGIVFWAFRTYAMAPEEPVETKIATALKTILDCASRADPCGASADLTKAAIELAALATKAS